MAWIKRNLILVISGVVALVLLGLGGFYLYSAIQKNQQIDTDIGSTKEEIKRLFEKPVTPTAENLKLAKQEAVKLNSFVGDAKKLFPSTPAPSEPLTSPSFKSLLANTISDLHRQAGTVPTRLETNPTGPYYFTFEAQRLALNLPPESLRPLYERLNEVQFISQALFKARVNRLASLKRAAVIGERPIGGGGQAPGGGNDYLTASVRVDQETGMALWPYEVVFDCFTPELAAVVEGLQGGKYGVLIKTVEVRPADELPTAPGVRPQPGQNPVPGQPPQRGMRGGNAPAPRGAAAPAVVPGPGAPQLITIINERLIRVTLNLDIIKPDSGGGAAGPGGFPGGGGRRGGGGGPPGGGGPGGFRGPPGGGQ